MAGRQPPPAKPPERATLWEDHESAQPGVPVQNLPDERESRLIKAMDYVHEHGVITNKAYRVLTGASDRTAHRDLELLVERGRLKSIGQRAARRYVLA